MTAPVVEDGVPADSGGAFRGGFADPVFDAQRVFRCLMEALARPGTVQPIADLAAPPAPLSPTAGAIAATLLDRDTNIWLDPALAREESVVGWLTFHTAAPIVAQTIDAHFALVSSPEALPSLEGFARGTQEYPDRSTTIILQIDSLEGGRPLELTGPGIERRATVAPIGLSEHFRDRWADNNAHFPRGVDLILAAPGSVIGLPRTTRIENGAGG